MSVDYSKFRTRPAEEAFTELDELVADLQATEEEERIAEAALKRIKAQRIDLAERQIPELMDAMNLESFTTTDGYTIKIRRWLSASVPVENRERAWQWLRDNGYGDIIKNAITVPFTRGEELDADALSKFLDEQEREYQRGSKVEPSTLRAFLKERLEEGVNIPLELFGAFEKRTAKIS